MKIFGKYKGLDKIILVAVGNHAEEIARDIGKSGPIARKLFEGFDVLWWDNENGETSNHLKKA
jgi:hypothetical protein